MPAEVHLRIVGSGMHQQPYVNVLIMLKYLLPEKAGQRDILCLVMTRKPNAS